ncbi:MAG: uroporphyrinogen-III synthase [Pseudomonadota bacterium]|nr:uroporphyrinogen-III synthase [Pseudomonadota bacterium]
MAAILLTRPRASSLNFAKEIEAHGYEAVLEPLLTIVPHPAVMPDLSPMQAVMITSSNALEVLAARTNTSRELFTLPCFCVGPRTAREAKEAGFSDVRYATGDSADLAAYMLAQGRSAATGGVGSGTAKGWGQGGEVLHISGQITDGKAQRILEQASLKVTRWPIYAADPVQRLSATTLVRLAEGTLDAVTVFSVRTGQVLKGLLAQHGLEACCEGLVAIGLSDAVADVLRPLPWRKLKAAAAPTENEVITCLKQTNPVS